MIRRHIEDTVQQALVDTPVVLLNGARQTGKTTLALALAEKSGAARDLHVVPAGNTQHVHDGFLPQPERRSSCP